MKNKILKAFLMLIAAITITMGMSGCEKRSPKFSVSTGESQIRKIMNKNRASFSPGSEDYFEITSINFQKVMGNEYLYAVKYDSKKTNGECYDLQQGVFVGEDSEGFYIRAKPGCNDGSRMKFR